MVRVKKGHRLTRGLDLGVRDRIRRLLAMKALDGFDLFAKARPTSSTRLVHALAIFGGTLDAWVNASARKGISGRFAQRESDVHWHRPDAHHCILYAKLD